MSLRTLLTALLLTASCSAMADTEVVNLSNRTSTDLLPVAQNFIGRDGTVSAYGNQLIVNAAPGKIQDLRALLAQHWPANAAAECSMLFDAIGGTTAQPA